MRKLLRSTKCHYGYRRVRQEWYSRVSDAPVFPSFVGLGAQRCGTTWWFNMLLQHPDIGGPRSQNKELHILDRSGQNGTDLLELYSRQFEDDGLCRGEWSPSYLARPDVFMLLRLLPESTKFLVLLRNPFSRVESALTYRNERYLGGRRGISSDMIWRSMYGLQLHMLLNNVGRERVKVQLLEECCSNFQQLYDDAIQHLGKRQFVPKDVDLSVNRSTQTGAVEGRQWRTKYRELFAEDRKRMECLYPDLDFSIWNRG